MTKHSEYMHWAKTCSRARYNLATSGVGPFPLRDLPFDCSTLEINGPGGYGYAPLSEAIGRQYGVDPECIVTSEGTSMANHLAFAAILEPGDEVLIEEPVYELILSAASYVGASIKRFRRERADGWRLDPAAVRRAITPGTKLVIVTNLHNPTSVLAPEPVVRECAEIAAEAGALLLVDEVYLDAVYENTPRTAFQVASNVVVTSSLTKIYGVSGLRCGWIFAQPDLARRMWRLNDLFGASPSHPSQVLSVAAFAHLHLLRERARRVVEADRAALGAFLASNNEVDAVLPEWGTTCFMRLKSGGADAFLERLRADYETSAVPGRFFETPDSFRIGMGVDHEMFSEGLRRIGLALSE